jgi:hydroxymethylpyrimidine pyrophosphatase-like HAD family hydrolase
MLRVAGLGIAVSNGREEAKAVAKEITGRSIDDGVASAIEKYCL